LPDAVFEPEAALFMKPSTDINNELIPNAERAPHRLLFYNSNDA
jgi:hypothetical protein